MQDFTMRYPLTLTHILERSAKLFAAKSIASCLPEGVHRYSYADLHGRVHRLAHGLARLGIQRGDRVGTLCWNSYRHLELYFGVPCFGGVLHTLNLRLSKDQLIFIINHAQDRLIFVDSSLWPTLKEIKHALPNNCRFVVIKDEQSASNAETNLDYEELLSTSSDDPFAWPTLDEFAPAAMCYTSGTTGNSKGVIYTHRGVFLHSLALSMTDGFGLCERDTILQAIPMFHANGWGIPYAAFLNGAGIVFSGRSLQPADIARLIEDEKVTFTAGVPTLWMGLHNLLQAQRYNLSTLRTIFCAGAALPAQLIESYEKNFGIRFLLGWGMTETTPIATVNTLKRALDRLPEKDRYNVLARHGMPLPGIEVRIVDDNMHELPWDGLTMGELQVRGAWITNGYYNDKRTEQAFTDGWFRTGDVATIDPEGYIQIMDRTKDLVKSGGEWIPSVELENAIMAHPDVVEAAIVAVSHPKWQERPLAVVVPAPGKTTSILQREINDMLASRFPKWWLPDDIVFIDALPKTSVGKFNKRALRERFHDYRLPL